MLLLTIIFAVVHSGMASLRETGEKIIGERAYRIMFAGISLPLAVSTVVSAWHTFFWTVGISMAKFFCILERCPFL